MSHFQNISNKMFRNLFQIAIRRSHLQANKRINSLSLWITQSSASLVESARQVPSVAGKPTAHTSRGWECTCYPATQISRTDHHQPLFPAQMTSNKQTSPKSKSKTSKRSTTLLSCNNHQSLRYNKNHPQLNHPFPTKTNPSIRL